MASRRVAGVGWDVQVQGKGLFVKISNNLFAFDGDCKVHELDLTT